MHAYYTHTPTHASYIYIKYIIHIYSINCLDEGGLELGERVGGGVALDAVLHRVAVHRDDLVLFGVLVFDGGVGTRPSHQTPNC